MRFSGNIDALGISPALIGAAAPVVGSVASSVFGRTTPGGGSPTGVTDMPITVSPAMQQAFTPQFAPTMQQQQDSPGATQAASPVQYAIPGQAAGTGEGEMPSITPRGMPPTLDIPSLQPSFQSQDNYQQLITTGIIAAVVIVVANMYAGKGNKIFPTKSKAKRESRKKIK